jgi:NAD(P)-dependent dehydrogenase (short-subunit alcohol dehydrogenase family)
MRGIEGKVALVTGGASGIGEATARRFAEEGARVIVADVDAEGAHRVAAEIGAAAAAIGTDITRPEDVEKMVSLAVQRFGRLDVVHNNAASGWPGKIGDLDAGAWSRTVALNLTGHFQVTRAALPAMLENGGGAFVNMSSAAALLVEEGLGAYAAAKAGVIALTRQTAVEYGRRGIRANCICPGAIATPPTLAFIRMREGLQARMEGANPLRRLGRPEEVAAVVVFLASDDAAFINGATLMVDGGSTADKSIGLLGED